MGERAVRRAPRHGARTRDASAGRRRGGIGTPHDRPTGPASCVAGAASAGRLRERRRLALGDPSPGERSLGPASGAGTRRCGRRRGDRGVRRVRASGAGRRARGRSGARHGARDRRGVRRSGRRPVGGVEAGPLSDVARHPGRPLRRDRRVTPDGLRARPKPGVDLHRPRVASGAARGSSALLPRPRRRARPGRHRGRHRRAGSAGAVVGGGGARGDDGVACPAGDGFRSRS